MKIKQIKFIVTALIFVVFSLILIPFKADAATSSSVNVGGCVVKFDITENDKPVKSATLDRAKTYGLKIEYSNTSTACKKITELGIGYVQTEDAKDGDLNVSNGKVTAKYLQICAKADALSVVAEVSPKKGSNKVWKGGINPGDGGDTDAWRWVYPDTADRGSCSDASIGTRYTRDYAATAAFVKATWTGTANSTAPPVDTAIVDLKKPIIEFERPVTDDIQALIQRIVNTLLSLIATVAVIFIVVGGFRLAFSQGNQEAVAKGKKTLTWAIAGLAVALLTFAIINAITQLLY